MRRVLPPTPFDLINLFLDLQGFQIVKFRLMGLELCMELVLASLLLVDISSEKGGIYVT